MSKDENTDLSAFQKHLEECRRIVQGWPEWKRNILGAIDESVTPAEINMDTKKEPIQE
jgi:hypothetical protein